MSEKLLKKRVCVAMSGGVDSSVAAYLLQKAGYEVIGIFLKFWSADNNVQEKENKCCSLESAEDARRVAAMLKIPLYILNYEDIFKNKIVDHFILEYLKGKTPNPCVRCNQYIKFGKLLEVAKSYGADYLATGHYAKLNKNAGFYKLFRPKDRDKDQTYFLYNLKQSQLKYLLFPLAGFVKAEVRAIAKKAKLPVYQKKESQEICFIPDKFYGDFLKSNLKLKNGVIIDKDKKKIGEHEGLALYTIGQRKGIKANKPGPYYVTGKNLKNNELTVSNNPNDPKLFTKELKAINLNWLSGFPPKNNKNMMAQIRYQSQPSKIKFIYNIKNIKVFFSTPQKSVTSGQSIVFYQGNELLGGGIIK